jgi:hypothetical protein
MLNIISNKSIDSLKERERNGKSKMGSSNVYMTNSLYTNINTIWVYYIVSKLPKQKKRLNNALSPTITFQKSGEYNVQLIITNLNGCSDTLNRTIKDHCKGKIAINISKYLL